MTPAIASSAAKCDWSFVHFVLGFLAAVAILLFPGFNSGRTIVTTPAGQPASFRGLSSCFEGSRSAPRTLRVLYVHGMGAPKNYTARVFMDAIAARMSMRRVADRTFELPVEPLPSGAESGHVNELTYADAHGDQMIVDEVIWSPLTYEIKRRRLIAAEESYIGERARINGRIKQYLLNERMPDPLLYIGRMGPVIRNSVKQTICTRMLGGSVVGTLGSERCDGVRISDTTYFGVITESLGSAIAFDAIAELDRDTPGTAGLSPRLLLARAASFFMLANQLPLLNLNSPERDESVVRVLGTVDEEQTFRFPLEVVNISDPNDVLSYPVSELLALQFPKHRFVNVSTSLSWRLLGGLAAYPRSAHTGHVTNRQVIRMIAEGWPASSTVH